MRPVKIDVRFILQVPTSNHQPMLKPLGPLHFSTTPTFSSGAITSAITSTTLTTPTDGAVSTLIDTFLKTTKDQLLQKAAMDSFVVTECQNLSSACVLKASQANDSLIE